MKGLEGVTMELRDCVFPLVKDIKTGFDANEMLKDADVAIFLGGFPRQPGQERKDLLQINKKIF